MSNVEKLKEYLIGENGYLLNEISNGKVVMLSGEWGSGKTHFWKNIVEPEVIKDKHPYAYISLYGKTTIESIEVDTFMNIYNSVTGKADIISKMCSTSLSYSKKIGSLLSIAITHISQGQMKADIAKVAKEIESLINNDKLTKAGKFLNRGGIICFDDFERKSKDIDLNDLFGFITQLTLKFNCKIVLILNSDVFEGKEKEVFTNVKEKTVSKYLKFSPTCSELFEIIFNQKKYTFLKEDVQINNEKIEQTIKNTFCEVGIVNARILIQVLDNVLEWKKKHNFVTPFYIRYFVFVNINFILHHHIFVANKNDLYLNLIVDTRVDYGVIRKDFENLFFGIVEYKNIKNNLIYNFPTLMDRIVKNLKKSYPESENKSIFSYDKQTLLSFIEANEALVKSLYFIYLFEEDKKIFINDEQIDVMNQISNFIETGIL